ncbi:lactoylglutathione lyase [Flavobacteriaceae bacterium UJ101]|nr:lactoylglutathione lyase [Flavobacteriaceae bacterium UJ101]
MNNRIALTTLIVHDYDETIAFYTQKLGFHLIEDVQIPKEHKRWVIISPNQSKENGLVLGKAKNDLESKAVGNQTGGRVFLFLYTDDFWYDYNRFKENGVHFIRPPKKESYGTVAVFEDLYGNLWDLLEPKK